MIRGERFELDLGSDDDGDSAARAPLPVAFVGDILERRPVVANLPKAPTLKSRTGFPEHKKTPMTSRFKRQQNSKPDQTDHVSQPPGSDIGPSSTTPRSWEQEEKARIDQENKQKLARMTSAEIEEERQELMSSLSPELIQRLMQRTNKQSGENMQKILQQSSIDSGSNEADLTRDGIGSSDEGITAGSKPSDNSPRAKKSVSFHNSSHDETRTSPKVPSISSAHHNESTLSHDSVHFPRAPQPPPLDPSSETFFDDLHTKYFPSLPADPDKLEWMQTTTTPNTYDPNAIALSPEQIRFSFRGELIPPRTAAEIPVTAGLHHHGDAPDSAGYTIPELAHLARSTYPAQRCIAFQTLGRFLYRLGKGEFGNAGNTASESEDQESLSELAKELWGVVEREKVVEWLVMESEGQGIDKGRHLSAKSYATEAVWLWQKGGGRRWKAS